MLVTVWPLKKMLHDGELVDLGQKRYKTYHTQKGQPIFVFRSEEESVLPLGFVQWARSGLSQQNLK